jgi:hypothetical protein
LNFLPGESCGLHPSDQYVTWNQFIAESNRKPYCNSYQDSIDGRYIYRSLLKIFSEKLYLVKYTTECFKRKWVFVFIVEWFEKNHNTLDEYLDSSKHPSPFCHTDLYNGKK